MLAATNYGATEESTMKMPDGKGGEMEATIPSYPGRWATADDLANGVIATIRYVHENGEKFGIDPSKIVLEGLSGGGYVMAAVCGRLAVCDESNLVKLAISNCACAPGWYLSTPKEEINKKNEVRMGADHSPFIARAYAYDFDKQWKEKDPVLFPHEASHDILRKWPPTITISAEYDLYEPAV